MGAVIALIVALVIVLLWGVFSYNRLVRLRVRAEESWRDIDTQLKRRWDLIPHPPAWRPLIVCGSRPAAEAGVGQWSFG